MGAWLAACVGIARHRIDQAHTSLLMKLSVLTHWIKRKGGS